MHRPRTLVAIMGTLLACGLAACGSGGSSSGTATTSTETHSTSSTSAPASTASSPTAPSTTSAPASSSEVPIYQPSSVVSQATGHTELKSPDPVSKVTDFYEKAFSGWTITSSTKSGYNSTIIAKRGSQGATVSISSAGSAGTTIAISTYTV